MSTIENVWDQVVLLIVNSRQEINLAPGEKLTVADSEVRNNASIEKLKQRGMIKVSGLAATESASGDRSVPVGDLASGASTSRTRNRKGEQP